MPDQKDQSVDPARRALLIGGLTAAGGVVVLASGARSQTAPDPMASHDMSAMASLRN